MEFLINWKQVIYISLLVGIFFTGYHLRGLQDQVTADKAVYAEIEKSNNTLLSNNKIDNVYNKVIDSININDEKYGLVEISNEKNAHCTIPISWVHTLNAISR